LLRYQLGVTPPNKDIEDKLKCMENQTRRSRFFYGSGKRENDNGSAHETGDAADISSAYSKLNNKNACEIVKAAKECGFKRACQHKTSKHIHVDTDPKNKGGECGKGVGATIKILVLARINRGGIIIWLLLRNWLGCILFILSYLFSQAQGSL